MIKIYSFHFRKELFEHDSNILYTTQNLILNRNSLKSDITAICSVWPSKVYIMFVHGKNDSLFTLRFDILKVFRTIWIQMVFISCAMIMLYFLRRGDLMRPVDLISVYIDVMIAVIGGGVLRYRDKFEKIFFGLLLFGSFYINTIGVENFLFATFLKQTPERIDTFDKLAVHLKSFNSPIYVNNLETNHSIIRYIRYEVHSTYYIFI